MSLMATSLKAIVRSPITWIALCTIVAASIALALVQHPRSLPDKKPENIKREGVTVVSKSGNLQEAINRALPGDTIVLNAGDVFNGPFVLPNKPGNSYITIQTSHIAELPEDIRVLPTQSVHFAKLQTSGREPVIRTESGAHGYRFVGIEFSSSKPDVAINDLIRFGQTGKEQSDLKSIPYELVIDRCYIHGFSTQEVQRGISLNAGAAQVTNSYISEIHGRGYDSQAICGWNGPGPYRIVNNYLEAAGENIMFGGADPSVPNLVPSDIEIRQNHFFKPLSWKPGDSSLAVNHWSVKNLLELKNARRVVITENFFQNCWTDAQVGYAILFTVRNQDGTAPWSTIEHVDFTNNIIKNSQSGINLLGSDNNHPSVRAIGLKIQNNLFIEIHGTFLQMNGYNNVEVVHNTHFQDGNIVTLYGDPAYGFVYRDNVTLRADTGYGIKGDASGEGTIALEAFTPKYVVKGNLFILANPSQYPRENLFPTTPASVRFVNVQQEDFRLAPESPYKSKASDRLDPGCDFAALEKAKKAQSEPNPSH